MEKYNDFMLNRLIGVSCDKFLSYDDVLEALSLSNNPRIEEARRKIQDFFRAGEHNRLRTDKELLYILGSPVLIQYHIFQTIEQIHKLLEKVTFDIISLLFHQELTAQRNVPATLDEVISAAVLSGDIKKPSDWVAVLMLLHDMGHEITSVEFINKLRYNPIAARLGLPLRQTLDDCYVKHTPEQNYPNWPVGRCSGEKMERYNAIAKRILPLVKRLSL